MRESTAFFGAINTKAILHVYQFFLLKAHITWTSVTAEQHLIVHLRSSKLIKVGLFKASIGVLPGILRYLDGCFRGRLTGSNFTGVDLILRMYA